MPKIIITLEDIDEDGDEPSVNMEVEFAGDQHVPSWAAVIAGLLYQDMVTGVLMKRAETYAESIPPGAPHE